MRLLFALLFGGSILFAAGFAIDLGRPWRSEAPTSAWLHSALAWAAVLMDGSLLLSLFRVNVPLWVFAVALMLQDAVFGWRWSALRRARADA